MDRFLPPLTDLPDPTYVESGEGYRIATYSWGSDRDPTVLAVHGFGSSAGDNWVNTGWVRDLGASGLRVLAVDLRGHGASDKPHDPSAYSMDLMLGDLITVLDTYLVDDARYLGYSLGGRIGWLATTAAPEHISRAVLGGVPDGRPLGRMDLEQMRAFLDDGTQPSDRSTQRYIKLGQRVPGNDLRALMALGEGLRLGDIDPGEEPAPQQPVLFATGSRDEALEDSRRLAGRTPQGSFFEIPDRDHFNAPGCGEFRRAGIEFLSQA